MNKVRRHSLALANRFGSRGNAKAREHTACAGSGGASRQFATGLSSDRHDGDLSPQVFTQFQTLIYNEAGIWLGPHKTALLIGRLSRRLRSLHLRSMAEYFALVTQPDQQHERVRMIDCITTNETRFFREPRHFEFLAQTVFPRWREEVSRGARAAQIRIWSAGCSSGEEPYSLAMMLLDHFGDFGWKLEIVATDISTRVLEEARAGIFPVGESKDIPAKYLSSYFLRGTGEQQGHMKVCQEVQELVTFSRVNLHADSYNISNSFDLIFLRNVMIYFDQKSKNKVLAGLLDHLSPSGYLFVGHSESLQGLDTSLKPVGSSVYSRVGKSDLSLAAKCEPSNEVSGPTIPVGSNGY